jgi:hypothetical protein
MKKLKETLEEQEEDFEESTLDRWKGNFLLGVLFVGAFCIVAAQIVSIGINKFLFRKKNYRI